MSGAPAAEPLVLALTTTPDADSAERLLHELLAARLIACGNVVPGLTSLYRWEGETARESETLVLMKTPRARLEALFERIGTLHPYEVPELLALPVEAVSDAYGRWVRRETTEVIA